MKTMRKIVALVLCMILCLSLLPTAFAEDEITVGGAEASVNDEAVNQSWYGGWQKKDGKWYFIDGSGNKATGLCKDDKGVTYYFDANGVMQTGWLKDRGVWYYLNTSGAMQTGWVKVGGVWYYMNANGAMQTGWQSINGKWYFLDGSGAMRTGWVKASGKWYYLGESGAMLTRTVIHTDSGIYAVGDDGAMLTNTTVQTTDGSHYHFGADGRCDNRY